jgi:hypothetical protein
MLPDILPFFVHSLSTNFRTSYTSVLQETIMAGATNGTLSLHCSTKIMECMAHVFCWEGVYCETLEQCRRKTQLKSYNEKKVRQIPWPSFTYFVSWEHQHHFQAASTIVNGTLKINMFLNECQIHPIPPTNCFTFSS